MIGGLFFGFMGMSMLILMMMTSNTMRHDQGMFWLGSSAAALIGLVIQIVKALR